MARVEVWTSHAPSCAFPVRARSAIRRSCIGLATRLTRISGRCYSVHDDHDPSLHEGKQGRDEPCPAAGCSTHAAAFIGATAGLVPVKTVAIRATEASPRSGSRGTGVPAISATRRSDPSRHRRIESGATRRSGLVPAGGRPGAVGWSILRTRTDERCCPMDDDRGRW